MVEFKTSFIPKKPLSATGPQQEGISLVFSVALILFFVTAVVAGGVFFYGVIIKKQEASLTTSIERAKEAVEPELVEELGRLDARIKSSGSILDNHLVASSIFKLLEELTFPTVSFESFYYTVESDGTIALRLSGVARNYESIALQSVAFGENQFIESPIFSNLQLNQANNVAFNFTGKLNKRLVLYKTGLS